MNFTLGQWGATVAVDILIKALLITALGVFVTFGMVPIFEFVFAAIILSAFHFVCLFLACIFVVSFEMVGLVSAPALTFALMLIGGNLLFFECIAAVLGSQPPGSSGLASGLLLTATNLVPVLSVTLYGCAKRRQAPR